MTRVIPLALLAICGAFGQFRNLATTDDGFRVYFSSSQRLKDSGQNLNPKLFVYDLAGLRLYAERDAGQSIGWTTANFYQLTDPELSGSGAVLAYTAGRPCYGGSGCLPIERYDTTIEIPGRTPVTYTGRVRLSHNGRYALIWGLTSMGNPGPSLIDLSTGEKTSLKDVAVAAFGRQTVADDGTVLVTTSAATSLRPRSGTLQTIAAEGGEAVMDPAAAHVVYGTAGRPRRLVAYDVAAKKQTVLATSNAPFAPSISSDGAWVAYLAAVDGMPQLFLVSTAGGAPRQLTNHADGITEAVLSGNAQAAFAVTGAGPLLRIDVPSGAPWELIPRTPDVSAVDAGGAPGSLMRITGTGLAAETAAGLPPLPSGLAGVQVKLNGAALPLYWVSPTLIWAQIPWQFASGQAAFQLVSGNSPFEGSPDKLTVRERAPAFYAIQGSPGNYDILAVHQNWDALVTADRPAAEGEIVHTYMSGLGPVTPPIASGAVSPVAPLSVAALPECTFWDSTPNPTQVVWAGLAPGMIGIYQVSMRVPTGLRVSSPNIVCGYGELTTATGSFPVRNTGTLPQ